MLNSDTSFFRTASPILPIPPFLWENSEPHFLGKFWKLNLLPLRREGPSNYGYSMWVPMVDLIMHDDDEMMYKFKRNTTQSKSRLHIYIHQWHWSHFKYKVFLVLKLTSHHSATDAKVKFKLRSQLKSLPQFRRVVVLA